MYSSNILSASNLYLAQDKEFISKFEEFGFQVFVVFVIWLVRLILATGNFFAGVGYSLGAEKRLLKALTAKI